MESNLETGLALLALTALATSPVWMPYWLKYWISIGYLIGN